MKAKPWERNRQVDNSLSAAIQQNNSSLPPVGGDLPLTSLGEGQLSTSLGSSSLTPGISSTTNGVNNTASGLLNSNGINGLGSSYGSMGSSYGGMGSSYGGYGGYGSSYGGYGGMSSMYGGYGGGMYGGGYGMGGMYGRFGTGDPNNPGVIQNMLQSLGEIARTMEMNAHGLIHLGTSTINLFSRVKGWGFKFIQFIKDTFKKIIEKVVTFFQQKGQFLFLGQENEKQIQFKMKCISMALKIAFVMFILSMTPMITKMLKNDAKEIAFKKLQQMTTS